MEKQEEKKPRLLVFGSSVARGAYANNFHGWAYLLEKQLEDDWEVINFSESGSDTKRARQRLDIVKQTQAKVVIISLSLANEGFNNPNVVTQFTTNLRKLVDDIQAMKSIVVVGGVYPNGFARQFPWMYDRMKQANAIIAQWSDVDMMEILGHGEKENMRILLIQTQRDTKQCLRPLICPYLTNICKLIVNKRRHDPLLDPPFSDI